MCNFEMYAQSGLQVANVTNPREVTERDSLV